MRPHDAQRKADAAERARLKAEAREARAKRIAWHWSNGVTSPREIGRLMGCNETVVSKTLAELGLRPYGAQLTNRRKSLGAIIEKVREA